MNVFAISTRVAATGAAAALGAAALVGLTSTAANATPVTNTYTCSYPSLGLGPWTVTLLSDAPILEGFTEIPAGFGVTAGLVELTNTFTIPKDAYDKLGEFGVEDVSFPDFAGTFGATAVPVDGMAAKRSEMTASEDGMTYSFQADGANAPFEVPAAGMYDVVSPEAFNLTAAVPGIGPVGVPCALAEGTTAGSYASINVFKNDATATGTPVAKTLKTTKVAKLKTMIAAANEVPTGKVIVKEGSKKLGTGTLNDAGKATVKMGMLKKGKHTVKVIYKGDGYTNAVTSDEITFTVKKP